MYFRNEYQFLSNFTSCKIVVGKLEFDSVEAYYQAMKSPYLIERESFIGVCGAKAKNLGKLVSLRKDWDKVKLTVMRLGLVQKFKEPKLRELLLGTGQIPLIEENTWGDRFWGVCKGKGLNHLGQILEEIRREIQIEEELNTYSFVDDFEVQVINRHKTPSDSSTIYCGRGTPLGNPYIAKNRTIEAIKEVIGKFEKDIRANLSSKQKEQLNLIWKIGKNYGVVKLQCSCHPRVCHCDVIKSIVLEKQEELREGN